MHISKKAFTNGGLFDLSIAIQDSIALSKLLAYFDVWT
jgi:hypothetical protein